MHPIVMLARHNTGWLAIASAGWEKRFMIVEVEKEGRGWTGWRLSVFGPSFICRCLY